MAGKRMMRGRMMLSAKRGLLASLVLFVMVSMMIVIANSLSGYGLHWDYSISKYVGLELWSSITFVLSNIIVAAVVGRYAWKLGVSWRMPRIYFYCVFVMVVALIWLSMCPTALCDFDGKISLISWMHHISSRTMFLMMLIVGVMLMFTKRADERSRTWSAIFVAYGVVCMLGYLTNGSWFVLLVWESLYIDSFLVMLLMQGGKQLT